MTFALKIVNFRIKFRFKLDVYFGGLWFDASESIFMVFGLRSLDSDSSKFFELIRNQKSGIWHLGCQADCCTFIESISEFNKKSNWMFASEVNISISKSILIDFGLRSLNNTDWCDLIIFLNFVRHVFSYLLTWLLSNILETRLVETSFWPAETSNKLVEIQKDSVARQSKG